MKPSRHSTAADVGFSEPQKKKKNNLWICTDILGFELMMLEKQQVVGLRLVVLLIN